MMEISVQNFENIEEASKAAAEQIIRFAGAAIAEKGFFTIVMAGGQTPQQTYELLGEPSMAEQMAWQQSHFFWGDERWVPSGHPESNFSMAHRALFSKVPIPASNIHQISTGHLYPETGATMYEKHLHDFFYSTPLTETSRTNGDITFPSFDLVLLGMGNDGHTASLFPGSDLLEEKKKWVAAVTENVGSPPVPRITFTLPLLNQAKNVIFILAGSKKREILDTILHQQEKAEPAYPAALVKPEEKLIWIVAENS